jgi:hypothetical protein
MARLELGRRVAPHRPVRRVPPILLALPALALARALPADGAGLYLRLAAATGVVLVPGALAARGLSLDGAAPALVLSLGALFLSLALMFLVHGSLWLALGVLAGVGLAALVPALRVEARRPGFAWFAMLVGGAAFGLALWHIAGQVQGDALFHLARVRKLEAFGSLSLRTLDEFRDGGLHPGYAFPLWHGFLAAVARVAGVDPTAAVLHEPSVLAALATLLAYEAGHALFRSAAAGVATALAQIALIALAPGDGGAYRVLDLPATASRQLLVPAALALVFTYIEAPRLALLLATACAGLTLALVHATYAIFILLPLAGFLAARAVLDRRDVLRGLAATAVVGGPTVGVVLWLLPLARSTVSHEPTKQVRCGLAHGIARYPGQFDVWSCDRFRLAPEVLARGGAVAVAALVLVPLCALAWRRRFAAFAVGGSVALLALLLVPTVFVPFADAVSVSQARRAGGFVPLAFAFAGGAAVLAGLVRAWILPVALGAGIALQLAWPGDFGYVLHRGGPALATWIAAIGGAAALVGVAILRRPRVEEARGPLVAVAAALFVAPVAWHGLTHLSERRRVEQLPRPLVEALRTRVPRGEVVFSDVESSYLAAAYAPVYVAVAPPAHVADTKANRPHDRARDAARFLATGDLAIPRRYGARWILLDRRRTGVHLHLPQVYTGVRFTLYRLPPR